MNLPDLNNCKISVIGLGYVGLPVALAFARGTKCFKTNKKLNRKVIGFDISQIRIKELNVGIDKTNEFSKDELNIVNNITYTNKFEDLIESDVFILTVPTPIDKHKKPDFSYLVKTSKTVGLILKETIKFNNYSNQTSIVIFESTVYPGTTEEICIPLIERSSIKCNPSNLDSEFYGYSPERINPSDRSHQLRI